MRGKWNALPLFIVVFLSVMLVSAIGAERVYACSCMPFENYRAAMEASSHVLDATVISKKEKKNGNIIVTLAVSAVWKGTAEQSMEVTTASDSAACGYDFQKGQRYAVFANEYEGELQVSLCSATTLITDDSPIFDELDQPEEIVSTLLEEGGVASSPALAVSENDGEPYHPEQIQRFATQTELEQKLESRKTGLIKTFFIVGVVLIVGAVFLLFMRRKR